MKFDLPESQRVARRHGTRWPAENSEQQGGGNHVNTPPAKKAVSLEADKSESALYLRSRSVPNRSLKQTSEQIISTIGTSRE